MVDGRGGPTTNPAAAIAEWACEPACLALGKDACDPRGSPRRVEDAADDMTTASERTDPESETLPGCIARVCRSGPIATWSYEPAGRGAPASTSGGLVASEWTDVADGPLRDERAERRDRDDAGCDADSDRREPFSDGLGTGSTCRAEALVVEAAAAEEASSAAADVTDIVRTGGTRGERGGCACGPGELFTPEPQWLDARVPGRE